MTEECHDNQHQRCATRTIDGFRCGCWCHESELDEHPDVP